MIILRLITTGQDMLGLTTGNYSGSMGVFLNPASIANTKLKSDLHFITVHSFFENNYFYLPAKEASIITIAKGDYDFPYFPKPYGQGERNIYSYYDDKSNKNIYSNSRIVGPSVMFSYKDHVIAFHTSYRVMSSTRRLPYDIANFMYYAMDFKPQHNVYYIRENFDMASMAWWEAGLTYATVLKRDLRNHWSAGITVNHLIGYSGSYLTGNEARYVAYNDSILNVDNLDAEYGLAFPVDYETDEVDLDGDLFRGSGLGFDIGFVYQFRGKPYSPKVPDMFYRKRFESYDYKLSVAIMDIGWIKFTKNAEKHVFDNVGNPYINVSDLEYDNLRDEIETVSEFLYGDPDASYRADHFSIYLPMALSVQFDYHYIGAWYLNSSLMMPLHLMSPMIERPTVIAVSPRYEIRALGVTIPLVLYDFKYPRIGLSLRFYGLTIGSDNLGGFFKFSDFTGGDVYLSYKFNIYSRKYWRENRKNPCSFD